MNVLVIDGQGGGLGRQFILALRALCPGADITAVGTNALATGALLRAGVHQGASGENAVIYNAGRADLILGPIGIIVANGICGEVSPAMAAAVSGADANKILIPSNRCSVRIPGADDLKLDELLRQAVDMAVRELAR